MGRVRDRIQNEVESWAGITSGPHQFGAIEFLLNGIEIGHLHGDHLLDAAFSKPMRDVLVAEGRAETHHFVPDSGWISFRLRQPGDADHALWLLRLSYLRHVILLRRKHPDPDPVASVDVPASLAALNLNPALRALFEDLRNRTA
jgi:hypothetical protein